MPNLLQIVSYWHVWSDADGVSHQTRCQLTEFQKAAIQPTAAPQWIGTKTRLDNHRLCNGAAGRMDRRLA